MTGQIDNQHVEALVARCLHGEQTAYSQLYDLFAPGIYRLCYGLLLNPQDAEDVMQESFVYAFKNLKRYDANRASFKTWLYTITISRCRNMYRRKRPVLSALTDVVRSSIFAPEADSPEAAVARHEAQNHLEVALSALSPNIREAIVLRYGHGLTYREIAEVMGCPQKTAESRVRLGHEGLRKVLQPEGHALLEELLSWSS